MHIENLSQHRDVIPQLAAWHFDQWRDLTGFSTVEAYADHLQRCATSSSVPFVVVALRDGHLTGSASVVACDMKTRPDLTPWLAQVFVEPTARGQGTGGALIRSAVARCAVLGFPALYLFTSGELPAFYTRLGWQTLGLTEYLGKPRTIMQLPLGDHDGRAGVRRGLEP